MTELPLLFGPDEARLVGIVTKTEHPQPLPVVCLLLNQGIYHRIGPRRINVKLARALAAVGISTLRFDLSGVGDSANPAGDGDYIRNGMQDMKAAMDAAQSLLNIDRFVVVGLCSGGHYGLTAAAVDPRLVGVMMFETYGFASSSTLRMRQIRQMLALPFNRSLQFKAWKALRQRLRPRQPSPFATSSPESVERRFREDMSAVAQRGMPTCMLYSGSVHMVDSGHDQLAGFDGEPFMRGLEYHFDTRLDHNLTTLESQEIFITLARDWVQRTAVGADPSPANVPALQATAARDGRGAPAVETQRRAPSSAFGALG